jgi:Cft2 family RNA processing exonuclease
LLSSGNWPGENFIGLWLWSLLWEYIYSSYFIIKKVAQCSSIILYEFRNDICDFSIAKDIDAVLCTHASMDHVGGLPYLYGELHASCPVYMTVAASMMTQIVFMDAFHSDIKEATLSSGSLENEQENDNRYTMRNIKLALTKIIGLRFSQPIHLTGKHPSLN